MPNNEVATQNPLATQGNPNLFLLRDVRLMWRNFSGEPNQYNAPGVRNFVVFLTPEMGEGLRKAGFNVKTLPAKEEGDTAQDFVKVNVRLESNRPPKLFMVNSKGKRQLTNDMVPLLDMADLDRSDVLINRYERSWPDGRTTVTPYLQTIFAFLREDELEQQYADIPDLEMAGSSAGNVLLWQESSPEEIDDELFKELEG